MCESITKIAHLYGSADAGESSSGAEAFPTARSAGATTLGGVSRRIDGSVVLPSDAPTAVARVIVEVRDVTYADAPAPVVASVALPNVAVQPNRRIPFELEAPEATAGQQFSLQCYVDITGGAILAAGDLVSTQSVPVPARGDVSLDVPVSIV
jgi:uncharacterized lipoprotein YbaY